MLFLAYSLFITVTVFAARPTTTVDLGYAQYEGFLSDDSRNINFLGIRYAAAPTGEAYAYVFIPLPKCRSGALRWRKPQPPPPTIEILSAKKLPNRCWQSLYEDFGVPYTPPEDQQFGVAEGRQDVMSSVNTDMIRSGRQEALYEIPPRSEDCLFLYQRCNVGLPVFNDYATGSIATPANGNGSLPVIVWIHGFVYSSQSCAFLKFDLQRSVPIWWCLSVQRRRSGSSFRR